MSYRDFNPRSPCGERLDQSVNCAIDELFQSTLPVRGATATRNLAPYSKDISIHAPRAGSDKENN